MTGETCGQKDALVSYLYGECDAAERARFEAHLAACAECCAEIEQFRGVRAQLARWAPPDAEFGFTIVSSNPAIRPAKSARWLPRRVWMPAGLAAAAVLLLASAAAIANLDVRYGPDGLVVRTGWSREAGTGASATQSRPSAQTVTQPASPTVAQAGSPAVTQADLVAFERRLKSELAPTAPHTARVTGPANEDELLQRVQALIDQSERRQNRELAVHVAQVVRDFDAQRQTDLVRIQNGLGALQGSSAADRQLLNYLVKVSQRQ